MEHWRRPAQTGLAQVSVPRRASAFRKSLRSQAARPAGWGPGWFRACRGAVVREGGFDMGTPRSRSYRSGCEAAEAEQGAASVRRFFQRQA